MTLTTGESRLEGFFEGLKKHDAEEARELPPSLAGEDRFLHQLVFSFLLWESTLTAARAAYSRLVEDLVDCNDLRICLPSELRAMLGASYPHIEERAERLRATLQAIFAREHDVSLAHLGNLGKREARQYLDELDGMHAFVAGRVALLECAAHAFPIDRRLHELLVSQKAVSPELDEEGVTSLLERHFRAGESEQAYLALEAWTDTRPKPRTKKKTTTKASKTTKKPAKKTTRKKSRTSTRKRPE